VRRAATLSTNYCNGVGVDVVVSLRSLATKTRARSQASSRGIYGRQCDIKIAFYPSTSLVSSMPLVFHAHSHLHHRHYIILATDSMINPLKPELIPFAICWHY